MPDKQNNNTSAASPRGSSKATLKKKLLFWRVAASFLLLAVIALGSLLYFEKAGLAIPLGTPAPTQNQEDAVVCTAWCYTPLGETLSVSANAGETIELPQGPEIKGYTFLGWADEKGVFAEGGRTVLFSDTPFSAVYAIAFRDLSGEVQHRPYFPLDENNLFHPLGTVSRAEAAVLLYSILDTDLVGSGSFSDVAPSDRCYSAAATLKDLGVLDGSRFHPDEPISCEELLVMLGHFFPKSTSAYLFDAVSESDASYNVFCLAMDQGWIDDLSVSPQHFLTRAEAAHIFNLLSGRSPAETDFSKVGTILDVSFHDPYFWDIAEAAITHEVRQTAEGEVWSSSEALPLREEGLFFIGTALHCIDADGGAVINGSYGSFDFGSDGVITTGMPELDELVQGTLQGLVDPSKMDRERMLYILFNYVTYHNSYLREGDHLHEVGETGWANEEAYRMLTTRKGNCYNYAAEFYVLSRAIGYDAILYSGTITNRPHGWVEIEMDGEMYIFDTEIEFKEVTINNKHSSYYKVPYWKAKGWHYFRGEEIEAELTAKGYYD